jgi:Putative transmembrane family 234
MTEPENPQPSPFAYILSFLIVGLCWGFTTPFIRRAALTYTTPTHPSVTDPRRSWLSRQIAKAFFTVVGLLKSPGYAVPLLCNLTGSVWFFLLVGKAGKILISAFLSIRSRFIVMCCMVVRPTCGFERGSVGAFNRYHPIGKCFESALKELLCSSL